MGANRDQETHAARPAVDGIRLPVGSLSFCRPVAMEAICRTAVFPKSDTYGGEAEKRAVDGIRCELTLDFGRHRDLLKCSQ